MTEETQATPDAAPAAPAKPRAPKLTMTHDGVTHSFLKYPFPVKASKFPIKVNGAVVDAACTAGRGKAYTYILVNNTSFYVPGTLPVDAECTVNFPEGYKFDDAQAVRVSTYKPKKPKKAAAAAEGEAVAAEGEAVAADAGAAEAPSATNGSPKAKRRGK